MFQKKINQQGFLLIDVLLSISILATVIAIGIIIITNSIDISRIMASETTAILLIQEKAEELRNIRDRNLVAGRSWSSNFIDEKEIDYRISLDGIRFTRNTTVDTIADFANIIITIEWLQGGRSHQIEVRKRLYNLTT